MGISRRRALALIALTVAACFCTWRLYLARRASHVTALAVRRKLSYLNVSDNDLNQFTQDYVQSLESGDARGLYWLSVIYPIYLLFQGSSRTLLGKRIENIEEQICTTFLLSSDLSFNLTYEGAEVRYEALYDPYLRPCSNPIARK